MEILDYDDNMRFDDASVLVLGYFDGLHRGHQALFAKAREVAKAKNLKIVVLTFPEKPSLTFKKFEPDMLLKLTSDKKRAALFAENGVDFLVFKDLTSSFAKMTTTEFSEKILSKFNPKVIITGFDHKTGSDMKQLEATEQYEAIHVPQVSDGGLKISSTRIRDAINQGNIEKANALLGYSYEMTGLVVHGFARGRQLGYPTANLVIKDYIRIPPAGVYTVDVLIQGERHRGFASIGYNETFNGKEQTIEVHVFDFDLDIYGEKLTVYWLDKIRDMIKFDGIDALVEQMKQDEVLARAYQNKVK